DLAHVVLERGPGPFERPASLVEVRDAEDDGAAGGDGVAGRVQGQADRRRVELGPFIAVATPEREPDDVAVEGDGRIHVVDPVVHVVEAADRHVSAARGSGTSAPGTPPRSARRAPAGRRGARARWSRSAPTATRDWK